MREVLNMNLRQQKGMQIARDNAIKESKDGWLVKSQSSDSCYKVDSHFVCNCPDSEKLGIICKHAYAVRYYLQVEKETDRGTQTEKIRISSKQAWKAYTSAQNEEIRLFDRLLRDLVENILEPKQTMGRPRLSLRELVFCAIQKVYSQLSSRRARSLFVNAHEKEQIRKVPYYNAINKVLNRPELTPILHNLIGISAKPLQSIEKDFAIDSSGFRTSSFNVYAQQTYSLRREHEWLKAHIMTGVKSNVVTAIEITDETGADSPQLRPLVEVTHSKGFNIQELSADKAYSSRDNYEAVKEAGGVAYIPFRKGATGRSRGSKLWRKMFLYFQLKHDEFLQHYHRRSNAESTFAAIKRKFGETLKSKNRIAQENELLCKIIAYNLTVVIREMFELGILVDFKRCKKYKLAQVQV